MENAKEYDMPSGARLVVSVSSYDLVMALHDALVNELRGKGVGSLDVVKIQETLAAQSKRRTATAAGIQVEDDSAGDEGLNVIVDKALGLVSSRDFKEAVFACAEKAEYWPDGSIESSVKFQRGVPGYGVFDNPKCGRSREDFYAICKAITEVNLLPFGKALFSMFADHVGSSAEAPKSSTVTA